MRNEFIVTLFDFLVGALYRVNAVEYVKLFSVWVHTKILGRKLSAEDERAASGIGIDVFQIIKFSVIIVFLTCGVQASWAEYITYYLISSNVFTYFYYHIWGSKHAQHDDLDSQRRRFLNFLLAITFYILCYAHLYQHHYTHYIIWPDELVDTTNAIYLSVANAFTLTYGGFAPKEQIARVLFMTELINTFLFFTIIVSNSIPSINKSTVGTK